MSAAPEYGNRPDWHLNLTLTLANVDEIIAAAKRKEPGWQIAARYWVSQRRIKEICAREGVELAA